MRTEGTDLSIDIGFECTATQAGWRKIEQLGLTYVRVETLSASVLKTSTGHISLPPGLNAVAINLEGTLLARTAPQAKVTLIPPKSITYLRPSRILTQATRGEHLCTIISWPTPALQLLENWFQAKHGARPGIPARILGCRPLGPNFSSAFARFQASVADPSDTLEPQVVSFLYDVCSELMNGPDLVQLAGVPVDLPETIQDLIVKVRKSPASPWPLKDASDMAGYSPFHFSRVFKSLVGYGFHEFVDRCRTEVAVEMLLSTDNPVDMVANACGFGTTQGLRESVKEYLGLVPSELRSVPEPVEFPY